ncbi:MAG TPA: molybdopterin-dependent oxidoreductase [Terriglobia bacterium]|nr:molybdopterin-dependent oxidoreductase [Terriglobia bacterium]
MDRRNFIKTTAAAGASATLAGCGNPETQLIRFIPEEPLFPGIATWKPSICPLCSAGCGLHVRVMDGEAEVVRNGEKGLLKMGLAKKLEGNPQHPISHGKLCARGQAGIQLTYHPDRIRQPLRRTGPRGSGPFQEISWDDAMADVLLRLNAIAAADQQKTLGFLTRRLRGQRNVLISTFLKEFGAPPATLFEVFSDDVLREANRQSFGFEQLPTFDLARSRYVLSFGADFLGTWNSPVAHSVAYGEMRQGRPGVRAKFVQVEPRMSQTGANADEWVPVKPGTEGILALGIAHVIFKANLRTPSAAGRAGDRIDGWNTGLQAYTPEAVEKRTGVATARIERLAREFADNSPAVAIIGGAPLAHTNGIFQALAVNALNALVGSVGEEGGLSFTPHPDTGTAQAGRRGLRELAAEILSSSSSPVQVLFLNDANPVFGTPPAWRVAEALAKVPYIVSFGSFLDETSLIADLILPDHSFLESWVDDVPESGTALSVASVAAPVMRPLHQTRSMPDVVLDIGRQLQRPVVLPWNNYEDMLKAAFAALADKSSNWDKILENGGWWSTASTGPSVNPARVTPAAATLQADPQFDGRAEDYPFHFLPYASQAFLDGSLAHLPWLQELPDVISTAMWSNWVEINPVTARDLGIAQGDAVEVRSVHGTIQAPALISPGIAPDVVAMPVGQGHATYTRYASGRGSNPVSILADLTEPVTGALAWAATRVGIRKLDNAAPTTPLIVFAGALREHEERHR